MRLMLKRLSHTGSTLRSRPGAEKAAIAASLKEHVWPLIAAGKVKPVMDSSFPLIEAARAHARMETSAHVGKIMLDVGARLPGCKASFEAWPRAGTPGMRSV